MPEPHRRSGPSLAGKTIGLLGGSFNPAHEGHVAMSLHALKQLGVDEIWWMVSPQNPLKSTENMGSLKDRLAAAKALASHPKIIVTDIERQLGTRYTVDTLHALQRHFPRTRFIWLMGADNLVQIPKWRKGMDVFSLVPVAVFRRPTYAAGRRTGKAAQRFDRSWLPARRARVLATKKPPAWIVFDNKYSRLSGTEIRLKNKPMKG